MCSGIIWRPFNLFYFFIFSIEITVDREVESTVLAVLGAQILDVWCFLLQFVLEADK